MHGMNGNADKQKKQQGVGGGVKQKIAEAMEHEAGGGDEGRQLYVADQRVAGFSLQPPAQRMAPEQQKAKNADQPGQPGFGQHLRIFVVRV